MALSPESDYDSQRHSLDNKINGSIPSISLFWQRGPGGILKSTFLKAHEIPAVGGTYALLFLCQHSRAVDIGKLGAHLLPRGWYVYVGSAFGPGGLRARCLHHLRPVRRLHWHIDYLRPAASVQGIWFTRDSVPREHLWAEIIGDLSGASSPVRRFGSSDCFCPSHLFRFSSRPSSSAFRQLTLRRVPEHGPITIFSGDASPSTLRCAIVDPKIFT
jgi:Uri superfamily endonuclease